mmetsp:Transcript_23356/g.76029  ORF Transcript_23356/g.76029 Transcript_23356/m.76029 type:complete len:417 (+) Transcript_23356:404-1654(+)
MAAEGEAALLPRRSSSGGRGRAGLRRGRPAEALLRRRCIERHLEGVGLLAEMRLDCFPNLAELGALRRLCGHPEPLDAQRDVAAQPPLDDAGVVPSARDGTRVVRPERFAERLVRLRQERVGVPLETEAVEHAREVVRRNGAVHVARPEHRRRVAQNLRLDEAHKRVRELAAVEVRRPEAAVRERHVRVPFGKLLRLCDALPVQRESFRVAAVRLQHGSHRNGEVELVLGVHAPARGETEGAAENRPAILGGLVRRERLRESGFDVRLASPEQHRSHLLRCQRRHHNLAEETRWKFQGGAPVPAALILDVFPLAREMPSEQRHPFPFRISNHLNLGDLLCRGDRAPKLDGVEERLKAAGRRHDALALKLRLAEGEHRQQAERINKLGKIEIVHLLCVGSLAKVCPSKNLFHILPTH